jgi:aryl-alcohol dehydrogenase-like predicted oxidoreductase
MVLPALSSRPAAPALPTRQLGRTDMSITPVGFGAWAIGGADWAAGWGTQDDAQSIAAIRHGVDLGINWIDTAAVYGLGHSEEIVREALKEIPADRRPHVFTKCGLVWDKSDRRAPPLQVGDPISIRREVDASHPPALAVINWSAGRWGKIAARR